MITVRWAFLLGHRGDRRGFVFTRGVLFCAVILVGFVWGADAEPIPIDSIETLQKIGNDAAYPLDGDYVLSQDIDASDTVNWNDGAGFDPIGSKESPFIGSFNGQGHTISDLIIYRPGEDIIGLFGYVNSPGLIQNLKTRGGSIAGRYGVGGLAGKSSGSFVQCSATGAVSGDDSIGGLIGANYEGTVTQCFATGAVLGYNSSGGLIGVILKGTVTQCFATGMVLGGYEVGGLVGEIWIGTITQCYATGSVSGRNKVGGLIGRSFGGTLTECYATGGVSGDNTIGGLIGDNAYASVTASFWNTEATGQTVSGGVQA